MEAMAVKKGADDSVDRFVAVTLRNDEVASWADSPSRRCQLGPAEPGRAG